MDTTKLRDNFLSHTWPKYPPLPQQPGLQWGRLASGCTILVRTGQQIVIAIETLEWSDVTGTDVRPLEILMDGDIIAIWQEDSVHHVQLLVPCRGTAVAMTTTLHTSQQWHIFVRAVREYFHQQNFLETPTPTLVTSPGSEPFLDPFVTELTLGSVRRRYFLPFSPEFHLKKLLTLGWESVFEIRSCFRNNELGPTHQPEFWMAEWYRAGSDLRHIQTDVEHLIHAAAQALEMPSPPPLQFTTMAELFYQTFDFHLTPQTTRDELRNLAESQHIAYAADDSWDDLFFRLFLEKIERGLGFTGPLVVSDYPPSQAALARLNERGWADRCEVYWRGLELANGFHELNDPDEQERRFNEELRLRGERTPIALDPEFLQALHYGLPPSAGIALGLERFFMALTGLTHLEQVRLFPVRD
jgi:lysyl-tRNA synthetase class 2